MFLIASSSNMHSLFEFDFSQPLWLPPQCGPRHEKIQIWFDTFSRVLSSSIQLFFQFDHFPLRRAQRRPKFEKSSDMWFDIFSKVLSSNIHLCLPFGLFIRKISHFVDLKKNYFDKELRHTANYSPWGHFSHFSIAEYVLEVLLTHQLPTQGQNFSVHDTGCPKNDMT